MFNEAIHRLVSAISAGIDVETLIGAVPIHPTVAELISTALREMKPVWARLSRAHPAAPCGRLQCREAFERLTRKDVRYRLVIDMASQKT